MKFKDNIVKSRFFEMHPICILLAAKINFLLGLKGFELVVTDTVTTITEDNMLDRKSPAHRNKIAFDWRTRNIPKKVLDWVKEEIESDPFFEPYRYLSYGGDRKLIYYHNNGNGQHAHTAIHSRYSLK